MLIWSTVLLILFIAVVFGVLMGFREDLSDGWQRALIAAIAFGILGLLISYLSSRRK